MVGGLDAALLLLYLGVTLENGLLDTGLRRSSCSTSLIYCQPASVCLTTRFYQSTVSNVDSIQPIHDQTSETISRRVSDITMGGVTAEARSSKTHNAWVNKTLQALDSGTWFEPTMHWLVQHQQQHQRLPDSRTVYLRQGGVLAAMVQTSEPGEDVEVNGWLSHSHLFRMIRIYCHTGYTVYGTTESSIVLLQRYECLEFFGLTDAAATLKSVILEKLDVHTVAGVFDALAHKHFEDQSLQLGIEAFLKRHMADLNKQSLAQISTSALPRLCQICCDNDLNVNEGKLMEILYTLSQRKEGRGRSNSGCSCSLFLQPLTLEGGAQRSLWNCVRIMGLTTDDLLTFREHHPTAFEDSFYLNLMQALKRGTVLQPMEAQQLALIDPSSLMSPRTQKSVSCYPFSIRFNGAESQIVTSFEEDELVVAYACAPYTRGQQCTLPTLRALGSVLQLTAIFQGAYLHMNGIVDSTEPVKITIQAVNFKHSRWNKLSLVGDRNLQMRFEKLISLSTLENDGYRFDPVSYPDFKPGACILLKVVMSKSNEQVSE